MCHYQNQKSHLTHNNQTNHQKKSPKKNNQRMRKAILMIYKAKEPREKNKGKEINYKVLAYHRIINCKIANRLRILSQMKKNRLSHSYRKWEEFSSLGVEVVKTIKLSKNDLLYFYRLLKISSLGWAI